MGAAEDGICALERGSAGVQRQDLLQIGQNRQRKVMPRGWEMPSTQNSRHSSSKPSPPAEPDEPAVMQLRHRRFRL
jgi:hypothetical protein